MRIISKNWMVTYFWHDRKWFVENKTCLMFQSSFMMNWIKGLCLNILILSTFLWCARIHAAIKWTPVCRTKDKSGDDIRSFHPLIAITPFVPNKLTDCFLHNELVKDKAEGENHNYYYLYRHVELASLKWYWFNNHWSFISTPEKMQYQWKYGGNFSLQTQ